MKRCSQCNESKHLFCFSRDKQKSDGLNSSCKACVRAKNLVSALSPEKAEEKRAKATAWRKANAAKVAEHSRKTYVKHLESRLARAADYRLKNGEKIRAYFRELAKARPDRISKEKRREYTNAWRANNLERARKLENDRRVKSPEQYAAYGKRYCQAHPDKIREKIHRRRAMKAGVENTLTRDQWLSRVEEFNGRCAYCLDVCEKISIDHFRPIVKGGANALENIIPACKSCNSSKGGALVFDWLARGVGICPPLT